MGQQQRDEGQASRTRILLVEDNGTLALRIEDLLNHWGYEALSASCGDIALQLAETGQPDFALLDIRLDNDAGDMDGIEIARELRTRFDIPSIYLTAYVDDELLQRAQQTEPYGYLVKPLQELSLKSTLEMAVAKRRVDRQLQAALHDKELLMREVLHRTKNNMAMINSLLYLVTKDIHDERFLTIVQDTRQRINSMAMVQKRLYQSQDFANLDLKKYLHDLALTIFGSYRTSYGQITLNVEVDDGGPILVSADTAIHCGLALNELLTNAMKHAFPDDRTGTISITLHVLDTGEIELGISDTGIGLPEDFNLRKISSLGLRLVRSFVERGKGTLDIRNKQGSEFVIRFREPSGKLKGK